MWRLLLSGGLLLAFVAGGAQASAYDVRDLDLMDAARQRAVPVRLYWPAGAGPVALVVLSPGIGGSRRGYSYLGAISPATAWPACTCSTSAATVTACGAVYRSRS